MLISFFGLGDMVRRYVIGTDSFGVGAEGDPTTETCILTGHMITYTLYMCIPVLPTDRQTAVQTSLNFQLFYTYFIKLSLLFW